MIKLIGILIIVIGFILKFDTISVVLIAGVTTGLVSGMSIFEIITLIGKEFVDKRFMTLLILTLPVIGILERYGLKERASQLISRIRTASAGRILSIYQGIRQLAVAFGIPGLGGHVQFVRPLIYPMAVAAAEKDMVSLTEEEIEEIKGDSAAAENFGNFFAQNIFSASGGVLLIAGTLRDLKFEVSEINVALASIPVAIIAYLLSLLKYKMLDQKIKNRKMREGAH